MIIAVQTRAAAVIPAEQPHEAGVAVPGPVVDVIPAPRACQSTTRAGEPCKGTPGDDGFCAAHKLKGDTGAAGNPPPAVDADPLAETQSHGEEDA